MTSTEQLEAQIARQRQSLNAAAGALGHKAADALHNLDVQTVVDKAADRASHFADIAEAKAVPPARSHKLRTGLLVLIACAVGVAWLRRRS